MIKSAKWTPTLLYTCIYLNLLKFPEILDLSLLNKRGHYLPLHNTRYQNFDFIHSKMLPDTVPETEMLDMMKLVPSIKYKLASTFSKDSDQFWLPDLFFHLISRWALESPLCVHRRLWSVCVDAHADLSLAILYPLPRSIPWLVCNKGPNNQTCTCIRKLVIKCLFVYFVALRQRSTAIVSSPNHTFSWASLNKQ